MTTPSDVPKPTAEKAYTSAHIMAVTLLDQIYFLLLDLPAPGTKDQKIHWGHVGDLGHVNAQLHEVVKFLTKEKG